MTVLNRIRAWMHGDHVPEWEGWMSPMGGVCGRRCRVCGEIQYWGS